MIITLSLAAILFFVDIRPLIKKKNKKELILIIITSTIAVASVLLFVLKIKVPSPIMLLDELLEMLNFHYPA